MNQDILNDLTKFMKEEFEKKQDFPNQYVVAYYKVSDDSFIGYHQSTFCQTTKNIFGAKRYSGDNPYKQLEIIAKNLTATLSSDSEKDFFGKIMNEIKQTYFPNLLPTEVYLDAVYLAEDMPKKNLLLKFTNNFMGYIVEEINHPTLENVSITVDKKGSNEISEPWEIVGLNIPILGIRKPNDLIELGKWLIENGHKIKRNYTSTGKRKSSIS
jgi:hypothetical protein